jgi:hypothetical protein
MVAVITPAVSADFFNGISNLAAVRGLVEGPVSQLHVLSLKAPNVAERPLAEIDDATMPRASIHR